MAQATTALEKLKPIEKEKVVSQGSKVILHSVTIAILYSWETWILTEELQTKIQSMVMRFYKRLLGISYTKHITNEEIQQTISQAIDPHDDRLSIVKK